MSTNSPFNTDKYKKLILEDSGMEFTEYEDLDKVEITSNSSQDDNLTKYTTIGLPTIPDHIIDNAAKGNLNLDDIKSAFTQLFTELNERYGTDISFDSTNFSKSFTNIIQPEKMKALELGLSQAYSRFRVIIYMMYLNAIANISAQILDPSYIMSSSLPHTDKFNLIKDLFSFLQSVNTIYKDVNIEDSDMKLEKLNEDSGLQIDTSNEVVQQFLESLSESIKSSK